MGEQVEDIEELLNDIYTTYGHDLTQYSNASLKRRIERFKLLNQIEHFSELKFKVLNSPAFFENFIEELTVNVTEMFRDPSFYAALRTSVLPVLAELPMIRIWHAGCATGEEMYSMAILLEEEGLLSKSILYGTDINTKALEAGKKGVFSLNNMRLYSENYINAGGKKELSHYYTARYGLAKFDEALSKKMIFSFHNLVLDQSFNAFNLILCRNVLIYFERELQNRVISLFAKSLDEPGFVGLGSKETLSFSKEKKMFEVISLQEKIWKKKSL